MQCEGRGGPTLLLCVWKVQTGSLFARIQAAARWSSLQLGFHPLRMTLVPVLCFQGRQSVCRQLSTISSLRVASPFTLAVEPVHVEADGVDEDSSLH